jgi:formylmethanofuran--tetrahydromethanopterin N-formyltransferase
MEINGVLIEDSYCEAFPGWFCRILVTAKNRKWLNICAQVTTGFATSTIHCPAEAGIEKYVAENETPDGRPGVILLFFVSGKEKIDKLLLDRIGQCVLTCPTTACFDAFPPSYDPNEKFIEVKTGFKLKFFGDKFEEKDETSHPFVTYRVPVMDGIFVVQEMFKGGKGIAGGNFIIHGSDQDSALEAAEKAIDAIKSIDLVVTPFPGGIARSGSKVGSKYDFLFASTNHPLCPTLKEKIEDSELKDGENCVYEVIIDGVTEDAIKKSMKVGIEAACQVSGVKRISAGNYGGKLGKFQYRLFEVLG